MAEWYVPLTLALVLFVFEIPTQTFYLAALGIALLLVSLIDLFFAPGGLGAIGWFALFAVLLLPVAEYTRRALRNRASSDATNIDGGQRVVVVSVSPHSLEVRYRDTLWLAELTEPTAVEPGRELRIVSRVGNRLQVAPFSPAPH
jgi:membrane protein implicated in regulation of membrane protease activity